MISLIRRQSPALVVAIIALIAAFGGSALAGGPVNKKKAKKIANNVVTQRAPGLSVAHAATADSATTANSANTAGTANKVGPLSASRFDYRATSGAIRTTIGTFGNFVLTGACPASQTDLEATTNAPDTNLKSAYTDEGGAQFADSNDAANPGDIIDLNTDFSGPFLEEVSGIANSVSAAGSVTTVSYGTEDNEHADCEAWGTAFNS
jgi:hypothetical protein